jgi:hypothetical protein
MALTTRRGFLRTTSLGAATIGVLAAAPKLALADGPMSTAPRPTVWPETTTALASVSGAPVVVYVSELSAGSGTILVGERAIPFTDRSIVESLRRAIG